MDIARSAAAAVGAGYLFLGIIGFVLESPLFGLFLTNALHDALHILVGATLLYGARSELGALPLMRSVGGILLGLGALGFVTPDGFGLLPLGGHDIWLHLATGSVLLAISFVPVGEADPG